MEYEPDHDEYAIANLIEECERVGLIIDRHHWVQSQPTHSGWYLFWCGDYDASPVPVSILSDASGECFASVGQLGLTEPSDLANGEWDGWWKEIDTTIPNV